MEDKEITEIWKSRTGKDIPVNRVIRLDNQGYTIEIEGSLMVWWVPQIPMKAFYYPVKDVEEAKKVTECLALYDLFQYENNIKPDYCNMGGLIVYEDNQWVEWNNMEGEDLDSLDKN